MPVVTDFLCIRLMRRADGMVSEPE
jgi:hypothetical protein